jgi:hypothetical protein
MLRYRIAKDPKGRYFVLPALDGLVPLEETYTDRLTANQTADWCNAVSQRNRLALAKKPAAQPY